MLGLRVLQRTNSGATPATRPVLDVNFLTAHRHVIESDIGGMGSMGGTGSWLRCQFGMMVVVIVSQVKMSGRKPGINGLRAVKWELFSSQTGLLN
jgi:hypothetical protein